MPAKAFVHLCDVVTKVGDWSRRPISEVSNLSFVVFVSSVFSEGQLELDSEFLFCGWYQARAQYAALDAWVPVKARNLLCLVKNFGGLKMTQQSSRF